MKTNIELNGKTYTGVSAANIDGKIFEYVDEDFKNVQLMMSTVDHSYTAVGSGFLSPGAFTAQNSGGARATLIDSLAGTGTCVFQGSAILGRLIRIKGGVTKIWLEVPSGYEALIDVFSDTAYISTSGYGNGKVVMAVPNNATCFSAVIKKVDNTNVDYANLDYSLYFE